MFLAYIIVRVFGDVFILGGLIALIVCDHYSSGRLSKTFRMLDIAVCGLFVLTLYLIGRASDYPDWVALATFFGAVRVAHHLWYVGLLQPMRAWWVSYRQECWATKLKWYDEKIKAVALEIEEQDQTDWESCSSCERELDRLDRLFARLNRRRNSLKDKIAVIIP